MRVLSWGIALSVLYFVSNTVFAQGIGFTTSCEGLLKTKATQTKAPPRPMDFMIADFEDFYLELVRDTIALSEAKVVDIKDMEKYLNKKSHALNALVDIIRYLSQLNPENYPASANLVELANIGGAFGIDLKSLGMEATKEGGVKFTGEVKPAWVEKMDSIGIVNLNSLGESALDGKRSIGFAPFTKKVESRPRRKGGRIDIRYFEATGKYVIGDFEKNEVYEVPAQFFMIMKADTPDKGLLLKYDQDQGEWIVSFTNHLNPDGKIGF